MIVATERELRTLRGIIYFIRNRINGKIYVGQSATSFNKRYNGIDWTKNPSNPHLARSIDKYGKEQFEIFILYKNKAKEDLDWMETALIAMWDTQNPLFGYNKAKGGQGAPSILFEEFLARAIKTHGAKYSYDKETFTILNGETLITCNGCGGIFWQSAVNHTLGKGCWECHRKKYRVTFEDFVERVRKVHGNTFNYDKSSYVQISKKVKIECTVCKTNFLQNGQQHELGHGCPTCLALNRGKNTKTTFEEFLLLPTKFNRDEFIYKRETFQGGANDMTILHKVCNNEFVQSAFTHLKSPTGCPSCSKKRLSISRRRKVTKISPITMSVVKEYNSVAEAVEENGEFYRQKGKPFKGFLYKYTDSVINGNN